MSNQVNMMKIIVLSKVKDIPARKLKNQLFKLLKNLLKKYKLLKKQLKKKPKQVAPQMKMVNQAAQLTIPISKRDTQRMKHLRKKKRND